MRSLILAVCCGLSAVPANAGPLDGLLRTINRAATGAVTKAPAQPADIASLKDALDKAVAPRTAAAVSLAAARPVVERLLMTMGCATTAKALHALNRDQLSPKTYFTLDDDLHYTAMGVASLMTHDRRNCMQVSRITDLKQPTMNSLSVRSFFISPTSGEARNVTVSFRRIDGSWLIDDIGWFARS